MARKKVKLEWIVNDSARKATFKKRKKGLMKKVSELSTLCDVKACLIIYGPSEPHADVWPSMPDAMRVLARLKRLPEMEQSKKMMNQEALMRQRIRKLQEQLQKQDKENRELETTLLMRQCLEGRSLHDVPIEEVTALAWMTEITMNKVRERMGDAAFRAANSAKEGSSSAAEKEKGKTPVPAATAEEEIPRHDWFAEAMELSELMIGSRNEEVVQGNVDCKNPWLNVFYPLN
ncbi:agamous-like MADS-box protein AGL80 [Canna indica]|uniref:Agamous-like MADS-box protein AGL80 n=1 Tax=Canna indica TaxID=4628 RepID=A0AAQ3QSJ2_9LILI|nr:agamous-like MADS-box protein AGL80 [Canna indica]